MKNKILIDTHCHFFSKTIFTDEFIKLLNTVNINNLPFINKSNLSETQQKLDKAMSFCLNKDPKEYYEYMKDQYGQDFIAVPLMMDLSYIMEKFSSKIEQVTQTENKRSLKNWIGEKLFSKSASAIFNFKNITIFKDSYEVQLAELISLKQAMPDNIYPFYSFDPRKEVLYDGGMLGEMKKYVGKDKPFTGLKLYTSLGYSPTDPVLFDGENSVYGWCEKNNIPITIHSNNTGVSHIQNEIDYKGDIYYNESGETIPIDELNENMTIKYDNSINSIDDMVKEKQILHNHPKIWKKVLEKYPKLKLNFAHLGGSEQLKYYVKGQKKGYWTKMIIELMEDYPNVYTDLSCFYVEQGDEFSLKDVYEKIYLKLSKKAQKRLLYGSDFYLLFIFNYSLKGYLEEFENVFGKDFEKIAYDNPAKFLGINKKFFGLIK